METDINVRKTEHIRLCLTDEVEGVNKTTGFEKGLVSSIMLFRKLILTI